MKKKHSYQTRIRAFRIWQKLGYFPWKRPTQKAKKGTGDFYKGAFDSIPFLNEDAKRTFTHLLFRPGYMIRDYIKGDHERYLAPLTALIIFYAFFALVSAVLQPIQQSDADLIEATIRESIDPSEQPSEKGVNFMKDIVQLIQQGYTYLTLDQHPDAVDTRGKAALAALEGTLRSQGIPLFLGNFLMLWMAMAAALRRSELKLSALAAGSAYILCQFSFFMLFALLLTFGQSATVSSGLLLAIGTVDFHQWLGTGWARSLRLAIRTGLFYLLFLGIILIAISSILVLIAWTKGA